MKSLPVAILMVAVSAVSTPVLANAFDVCLKDSSSKSCAVYLEGVVDGALMYRKDVSLKSIEADGYESRALKYRAGKRYQKANSKYCASNIPVKADIVAALTEQVAMGNVDTSAELETVINTLMDCRKVHSSN
ncbi:hypothetical protein [Shewanella gaetbuli]|uniref:Rap1a immunity protein domain-containing protein n=1 Tax=Shewanella gaetbuli TaxID=220752 RepID=A0A9X1ZI36_9GAMM|nr:hypothetical protein [Shewanella gaetbuli]MCL1141417.1 hypothetical protein [Shewanella gaetbuli]